MRAIVTKITRKIVHLVLSGVLMDIGRMSDQELKRLDDTIRRIIADEERGDENMSLYAAYRRDLRVVSALVDRVYR